MASRARLAAFCRKCGARFCHDTGFAEFFWIATAWPNGAQTIAFAAMAVVLLSPRGDRAYTAVMSFTVGICLSAVVSAFVKFAVLPRVETFGGFSLVPGLVLLPAGALATRPWHSATFTAIAVYLMPLVAPANPMSYDTQQFYNSTLAIVSGLGYRHACIPIAAATVAGAANPPAPDAHAAGSAPPGDRSYAADVERLASLVS